MIRMMAVTIVSAFLFLAASPVQAQSVPVWIIDPAKSTLGFEATQQGAVIAGQFKGFSGDINFDATRPDESKAKIRIDMKSVDSKSPDRDQSLTGLDWFNLESFPESIYSVSKLEKLNQNQYLARGELELRGVKKTLDLPLTITFSTDENGNDTALAIGEVTLNRLDFGVGQGAWKDTQAVGNPVKVKISITAMQPHAAAQ